MSLDNPSSGLNSAAEFQTSALPWVTSSVAPAAGSPVNYNFPKVTRFITISNRDSTFSNSLSVAFTRGGIVSGSGGLGQQKFIVQGTQTVTFELRVKSIWIQGETGTPAFSVLAGLTNVDARNMPTLTGSNWENIG